MPENKQRISALTALVSVLIVAVAALGYMVYQTSNHIEALAATRGGNMAAPAQGDTIVPKAEAEEQNDPWALLEQHFSPGAWDPFKEMDAMHKRIDAMFDQAFRRFGRSPQFGSMLQGTVTPRMDLEDEGGRYVVRLDMPGTEDANINVSVENNVLTVEATNRVEQKQEEDGKVLRRERRLGRFMRKIELPEPVNVDSMETSYEDGVFTITIAKANEAS